MLEMIVRPCSDVEKMLLTVTRQIGPDTQCSRRWPAQTVSQCRRTARRTAPVKLVEAVNAQNQGDPTSGVCARRFRVVDSCPISGFIALMRRERLWGRSPLKSGPN